MVDPMKYKRMKDIYIGTELDIQFDASEDAMEANFSAYDNTCWYEDGMYNRNYRDFSSDLDFENAYLGAVKNATSAGRDPHIRWRARIFEFFLQKSLPGNCIEIGTGHGFFSILPFPNLQEGVMTCQRRILHLWTNSIRIPLIVLQATKLMARHLNMQTQSLPSEIVSSNLGIRM